LTQQRITTLGEALEQAMEIEDMKSYPKNLQVMRPLEDHNITQLQGHISTLTNKIQELTLPRVGRPQEWCTSFYTKGHTTIECSILRGSGPPTHPMVPLPVGPVGGVLQVVTTTPFHDYVQYHAFMNHQGG
jgi:hypothetical protein